MIFNKIKLNYNIKLIDDLFANKSYQEVNKLLEDKVSNSDLFYSLTNYILQKYLINNSHKGFFNKKFLWVVSYDLDDTIYINKFLNYYLGKQKTSFLQDNYSDFFSNKMLELNLKQFPKKLNFNEVVSVSQLLQNILLLSSNFQYLLMTTKAAFYEATENKFLIYPNNSLVYLSIVRNPLSLYRKYKTKSSNNQDALNKLINFNIEDAEKEIINNPNTYSLVENVQNWNANTKSWSDENVKNTFRGKNIRYEDLSQNTHDTFVQVIYHLKQSGMNIDIDYDLIKEFVDSNTFIEESFPDNESNSEIKMLSNNLDKDLLEEFHYQI